jgi:hypothetical protein
MMHAVPIAFYRGGKALTHDARGIGLWGYTRARCYSSPIFVVTIGILHIKEIREGP